MYLEKVNLIRAMIFPDSSPATSKDLTKSDNAAASSSDAKEEREKLSTEQLKEIENNLLLVLDDATIELPVDSTDLQKLVLKQNSIESAPAWVVEEFVQKFTALTAVRFAF